MKKTRKEREYSFPIRTALIHRLKVRMLPFKDADKHAKVFLEKFMDIVALFLMPLSYITFKALACMIDFMFALSTLTNQPRAPADVLLCEPSRIWTDRLKLIARLVKGALK